MAEPAFPAEIALLRYPHAQPAAIHGLTDLFVVADRLARDRLSHTDPLLRISHVARDETNGAMAREFDTMANGGGEPAVIILPPSLADLLAADDMDEWVAWLRMRHAAGAVLASVCSGGFLLAKTGLLAGRTATAHWIYADHFSQRFPDIQVDAGARVIDHGDVLTAGGLMAWTDIGLTLVARLLGPQAMAETARFLLVDPPAHEPRARHAFMPALAHGDAAVLRVQQWLQREGTRGVTIAAMADQANLAQRTFLRRFRKATGLNPTEYCQQLRVADAQAMLEITLQPVDQIAWNVGYGDPGLFRKAIHQDDRPFAQRLPAPVQGRGAVGRLRRRIAGGPVGNADRRP